MTKPQTNKTAVIMAGGTGGHIFPGLAVAEALRSQGWAVHWLGGPDSMESQLVPARGFAFECVHFSGVRGKGVGALLRLPARMLGAMRQSRAILRRLQPAVVIGFGGYITAPAGLVAASLGIPLMLHEQNSVAGMANKWLSRFAKRVFTAYPNVLDASSHANNATGSAGNAGSTGKACWVGNPLRTIFMQQSAPEQRMAGRTGKLLLLVVGGSLGAKALNDTVPQALALLDEAQRPHVMHQSGAKQIDALRQAYAQAGVVATLLPFIDNTAEAFAQADLVVCRAGASTVTELAAVGAAAVFVPFPHAVDDHQTANARYLVDADAAWLQPQAQFTAQWLAEFLSGITREQLLEKAQKAKTMEKLHATEHIVAACEELIA